MALVLKNRVKETSTTTGTGTYTLLGAVTGFQAFSVVANGNTCYYTATDGTDWEVGVGTWATGGTLARTTILASSNAGAAVNWGVGTRTLYLDMPAEKVPESILTTRGDLLVRDANVPARLAVGSALQMLGSDGTDVAWQSPIAKLLASGTVTSAATLDLVLTSYTAYRGLVLKLGGFVPATDAVDLYARFSTDGGSTYLTTSYKNAICMNVDGSTTTAGASGSVSAAAFLAGGISITSTRHVGNAAAEGYHGTFEILKQTDTALNPRCHFQGSFWTSDAPTEYAGQRGEASRSVAGDVDALRIMFSSGNIASGVYGLYGLV